MGRVRDHLIVLAAFVPTLFALALVASACDSTTSVQAVRGSASSMTTAPPSVNETLLTQCGTQRDTNCSATVPGLATCIAAHAVCDQYSHGKLERSRRSQETGPVTESSAIAQAVRVAAVANPPVYAKEMTLSQYNALTGELLTDLEEPSGQVNVWVVTVMAPVWTDGSPLAAPKEFDWSTVVFDQHTGLPLEDCIGCHTLTS